jgi:hypothetical protein
VSDTLLCLYFNYRLTFDLIILYLVRIYTETQCQFYNYYWITRINLSNCIWIFFGSIPLAKILDSPLQHTIPISNHNCSLIVGSKSLQTNHYILSWDDPVRCGGSLQYKSCRIYNSRAIYVIPWPSDACCPFHKFRWTRCGGWRINHGREENRIHACKFQLLAAKGCWKWIKDRVHMPIENHHCASLRYSWLD